MNSKLSKFIALVLVQCQLSTMLPAVELRTDLRQGMARLEHYLDRASAERQTQGWEQLAQSGLEMAMYEWESGALWLREQDGEAWQRERDWAQASYRREVETAYVRWASERVYAERAGFEGSGLEAALREAAELWTYGESGRTVDPAEAGKARALWEQLAAGIVDRYLEDWEERQGAAYVELESRFGELGLDNEERAALIRGAAESRRLEVLREYERLALAEGNRLMTELLYDQGSMKKLAAGEAAAVIVRELAREAESATEERTRELFQQLDTMISPEEPGDLDLSAEDWLDHFRSVFEEALARWEEAELGFLAARAEWEHDAEEAYLAGEESWNQAYLELTERQKSWETAILRKLDEGFAKWQENHSRLAVELEEARQEFIAASSESRKVREKMLESQETIYIRSRQMLELIGQGIESWFGLWDEKYLMVYTHMKDAVEREKEKEEEPEKTLEEEQKEEEETDLAERFADLDYEVFKKLLETPDLADLTNPNKQNVRTLRDQIELWMEACGELQKRGILDSADELLESAAFLIDADRGWISLAHRYREFAEDSARRLYELAGGAVEDPRGEPAAELLKAEALLEYWDHELEVAEALHLYAQETGSAIEDAAKTREELEKARAVYEESLGQYQDVTELVDQKGTLLDRAQEEFERAQSVLAGIKGEMEEAQRDYRNVLAAIKELNPALIYVELTELAKGILNFWEGTGAAEGEKTLEDTIQDYYRLSHEYADILRSLEIRSLIEALETGAGPGQEGMAGLMAKAEEARLLSRSGREEDLRAAAGLYPGGLLLTSAWGRDSAGEGRPREGGELLIELDRAYREEDDPEEREKLLALMRWVWEEAAAFYDDEVLLRNESIEYLKTGMLPEDEEERAGLITERYGRYHAQTRNQESREAGERVEQLINALKEGADTGGEEKALAYAAELREAGKGLHETGQEALGSFIDSFLEYAALRDHEKGLAGPADLESREQAYREALNLYTALDSWRYGFYDPSGLEEIRDSAEFAALSEEERELFLSYVESGDTPSLYAWIEDLASGALKKLERGADALNYAFYYLGEKEESRLSWLSVLAGHRARLSSSGVDSQSIKAIEPLFTPGAREIYLKGLEQNMYRIGLWFSAADRWDQTQYREDLDTAAADAARGALETGWREYQNGMNTDSHLRLMIHDNLEKLRYANEGADALAILRIEKEEALTRTQQKYNDYVNNEYEAAIQAVDRICADYNAAVERADESYRAVREDRIQLRKKQEIYDWAESIYLKNFGTNYDENYETPQEKLTRTRYARERALISVEVLREILSGVPANPDPAYSEALEAYKESRRSYYLAQVIAYESSRAIARQEALVREAELAEAAARSRLVGASAPVSPAQYELVYLVDDGQGAYKPVLAYRLESSTQNGVVSTQALRKPGIEMNEGAFRKYFGDTGAVSVEKIGRTETMTMAEWEAGEWLKKMGSRGVNYLNDVILASLYLKYCGPLNSGEGEAWFKNEKDPRDIRNYQPGDIPLVENFHGFKFTSEYQKAVEAALREAWDRVTRQGGGEEDIARYLLYRDRNMVGEGAVQEENLLKNRALQKLSESLGKTHENHVVMTRTYLGIAAGHTAAGVAAAIGAIFIPALWAISIEALALATIFYAMAGNSDFLRRQIESLRNDVKNLEARHGDMINSANSQFGNAYGAWTEAAARLKTEQDYLNVLYYGSAQASDEGGAKNPLSYDNFREGLKRLLNADDSTVSFEEAAAVYDKNFYEESAAGAGLTVNGAITILNAALDERVIKQQDLMEGEIGRLKDTRQEALGLYDELMNAALGLPPDREAELRALALRAGDPSLDIAERRKASGEYERLITELSLGTEDLRRAIEILLGQAFGDGAWDSGRYGQSIIGLEGELFGSRTRYDRPAESYTEQELLLLREAGLAAMDRDTALRLTVKEREWGLIMGDFLNQYQSWQEQVDQIRRAGLSEWTRARERMNEAYNNWRNRFSGEYQEKTAVWDLRYLEFVNEKQIWVEDQYLHAVSVGNSGLFDYSGGDADRAIEESLARLSIERMNRETIEPALYVETLLEDSILGELLNKMDGLGGRAGLGALRVQTAARRTSASESLARAAKVIGEMDDDMRDAAARLAAQQARQLIEEAIDRLYERLDGENRAMLEWEENLVQSYGYRIDGQIRRNAVVDSALFENYSVTQTVHRYEFYVPDSSPSPGADLSASALENLDADTIMYMAEAARWNLDTWGEKIFGRVENNKTVEHEVFRANKKIEAPVMVRDGALGAHIGYEPVLKDEVSYLHSPLEDAEDPGDGELGKILLDFLWNGMVSSQGYSEMGKAVYDQKFWAQAYTPNFTAPTIRSTVDFAMNVTTMILSGVITPFGAALLNFADDLLFSSLDLAQEYRSADEVLKSLTSSATTAIVSMGFGALSKTGIVTKAMDAVGSGGKFLFRAGGAAVKSYTSSVAVSAIQSYNFTTGEFDREGFVKSLYSSQTLSGVASAMVGAGLGGALDDAITGRSQKLLGGLAGLAVNGATEAARYGVYAADSLITGTGSIGERLGQAYENMGGITLNIANLGSILDFMGTAAYRFGEHYDTNLGSLGQKLSGAGFLELHLGLDGPSLSFGTGGIDVAGSLYSTVKHGLDYLSLKHGTYKGSENREILITNYLLGDWDAENTSMRIEAGSDVLQVLSPEKMKKGTEGYTDRLKAGGGRLITIADLGNADLNAVTLQHESHRDGYTTDDNEAETLAAVIAHTKMAMKMMASEGGILQNQTLYNDIEAYINADGNAEAFAQYVSKNYDSSADYWKLMNDGTLVNDNSGWLVDEDGNPKLNSKGEPIGANGIETGLLNILYGGTSGRAYNEFDASQIAIAQALMTLSGMDYVKYSADACVLPKNRVWTGNETGQRLNMDFLLEMVGDTVADAVFSKLLPGVDRYEISADAPVDIEVYVQASAEYARMLNMWNTNWLPYDERMKMIRQLNLVNAEAAISFIQDQILPIEQASRHIYQLDAMNARIRLDEIQKETSEDPFGTAIAEAALILGGGRYVWGAENPFFSSEPGADCSGAIFFALQLMGYDLPRSTADVLVKTYMTKVTDGEIRPGDIYARANAAGHISHVQTYTGGTGVINPFGDKPNTVENPGRIRYMTTLPQDSAPYRFDKEKLKRYYDPSRDILGGNLTVDQFNAAWQRIQQYHRL